MIKANLFWVQNQNCVLEKKNALKKFNHYTGMFFNNAHILLNKASEKIIMGSFKDCGSKSKLSGGRMHPQLLSKHTEGLTQIVY